MVEKGLLEDAEWDEQTIFPPPRGLIVVDRYVRGKCAKISETLALEKPRRAPTLGTRGCVAVGHVAPHFVVRFPGPQSSRCPSVHLVVPV